MRLPNSLRPPGFFAKVTSFGTPRLRRDAERAAILVIALLMTGVYLWSYRQHPSHPHVAGSPGWWAWFDQERYFAAATAWSQGNLDPAKHWYLPGYPILAAPFVPLLSVHAFLVPNLACLLLSFWLFSRISGVLAGHLRHARLLGAALFGLVTVASPLGRDIWVVPWSTTGSVPLVYSSLLAGILFCRTPERWALAFAAGLAGGLVAAFRPVDVLPIALGCALGAAFAGLHAGRFAPIIKGAVAAIAGVVAAVCLLGAMYLPIYGLHESGYIIASSMIGFDWRLIPLHWVTLVLDARPLLEDSQGLVEAFPWVALGLGGLVVFLVLPLVGIDRSVHLTVASAAVAHILIYMAYRDLHPGGLFRFLELSLLQVGLPCAGALMRSCRSGRR